MKVTDANGEGVSGAQISFSGPPSGPTAILNTGTANTDTGGLASVTATANNLVGPFTLSASVGGVATPAVFAFTNTSTSPAPTVTAISPATGDAGGGTAVTISGAALPGRRG